MYMSDKRSGFRLKTGRLTEKYQKISSTYFIFLNKVYFTFKINCSKHFLSYMEKILLQITMDVVKKKKKKKKSIKIK